MDYSLMFPQDADQSYKTLTPESVNDLSIGFLLDALTKQRYERDHIRKIMTRVTDDPEVIRYRCDVFEDFLRFPKLRDAMEELVVKLADLRDIERFQKDQEGSALWSLVNRLREIDDYVTCITAMKDASRIWYRSVRSEKYRDASRVPWGSSAWMGLQWIR